VNAEHYPHSRTNRQHAVAGKPGVRALRALLNGAVAAVPLLLFCPLSHAQPPAPAAQSSTAATVVTEDDNLARARTMADQGKLQGAEDAVRHFLAAHPTSGDAHFLLGYILFQQLHQQAQNFESSLVDSSLAKIRNERASKSLAEFTEGAKYRKPTAFDLKIVALDYVLLGDYPDADRWLSESVQWDPTDAQGWYYLGRIKYNENHFEETVGAFERCLKLDSGNVQAEDNLGLAYQGLRRTDHAIAAFNNAIAWQAKLPAKSPNPFIDLGSLLIEQNREQEAIPYLLQAVEIAPEEARAREQLGKAYLRLKDFDKAERQLQKAAELDPKNSSLHYLLGTAYSKLGQKENAQREFDKTAALSATHSSDADPK
jgi:Flp pilus assembly protein TadD